MLQLVRRVAVHRFQQMPDVVAEGETIADLADEPGGCVVENRHLRWAAVPGAAVELVDLVAGLAAEQFHDVEVLAIEHMHRQVGGAGGHSECVVLFGQTNQESGRMDAGLAGEAHQATGRDTVGLRSDDKHRIVQQRHQLFECFNPRLGHPISLPVQSGWESHCCHGAARLFSYLDTQITRLGGPNFAQLPINRPHCPVNDMLRDGMHQSVVHTGLAPYHPNSIDGDEPLLAGEKEGEYVQSARLIHGSAVRAQPGSFDDHFSQATMFYRSLTPIEQAHVVEAFTFELGKVYEQGIKDANFRFWPTSTQICASRWPVWPPPKASPPKTS
jgi:hypothetical protein